MYNIKEATKRIHYYRKQAELCENSKAYFAASVMYAVSLECTLLALCFCYPEEVRKTTIYKEVKRERKSLVKLTFSCILIWGIY